MPKEITADTRIEITSGESVALPSHDFIANAQMTREGADLRLTLPDGHSVVVTGYFEQNTPPDLIAEDGGRLTPHLVEAFLQPVHPGEYAAAGNTANDASPAGKVTVVVGEASIIHADGTRVPAVIGTQLHQGDVIETAKTGAVNIIFADNTAFAVSENARMSVDKFIYDSEQHNGTSFFSMLQGAFVYTSGLIGKSDPGNVNIETPVGTIGIRGTAAAGQIYDHATPFADAAHGGNIIANLEGAINIHTPDGANYLANHRFQAASFMPHGAPVTLKDLDLDAFMALHKPLRAASDTPFMQNLLDLSNQPHHHNPHQLQLQMPLIHHGMLDLHHGDNNNNGQTWGLDDSQQLAGGAYGLFLGGNIQPLAPLIFPPGPGVAKVPVVGSNSDDIFYINSEHGNIVPSGGPEFLFSSKETINGGGGFDTVKIGSAISPHIDIDFNSPIGTFKNIERFVLDDSAESFGNHVILSKDDVFAITSASSNYTLEIMSNAGAKESFVDVVDGATMTVTVDALKHTTTYTGDVGGGQIVSLVIFTENSGGGDKITVANI